jgi:eukaryotic-like serine/threonine-protein kinase
MGHGAVDLPNGIREGEILAGKYRIGKTLGAGAMGAVVAAHHLILDEKVAIKFMHAHPMDRAGAVARFVHEARAAVRIRNEHVVRIFDIAVLQSGPPYIVMEYLDGCDLAVKLRRTGRLRLEEAVDYILEACEAMAEAHRLGIVHRDLKPANLFLSERNGSPPSIKVLDFGISKTVHLVPTTLGLDETVLSAGVTQAKAILGSPFYMSPEQMESATDVDARADIWALGVTLFELVTGSYPYTGSSLIQVYSKMISKDSSVWRAALVDRPAGLQAILARCLAHDRQNRYASVGEFAGALAPFGSDHAAASLQRIGQTLTEPVTEDAHTIRTVARRAPGTTSRRIDVAYVSGARGSKSRLGTMLGAVFVGGALASTILTVAGLARKPGVALGKAGERATIVVAADPDLPPSALATSPGEMDRGSPDRGASDTTVATMSVLPAPQTGRWPRPEASPVPGHAILQRAWTSMGGAPPLLSAMRPVAEPPQASGADAAPSAAPSHFGPQKIKEMLGARE